MEKAKAKRYVHYDDETLEKMKRYYKIDDHDELLRFIKTHGLKNYDFEIENSWYMRIVLELDIDY
jgi:hypothetical protein